MVELTLLFVRVGWCGVGLVVREWMSECVWSVDSEFWSALLIKLNVGREMRRVGQRDRRRVWLHWRLWGLKAWERLDRWRVEQCRKEKRGRWLEQRERERERRRLWMTSGGLQWCRRHSLSLV